MCGGRTKIENSMRDGLITQAEGVHLLGLFHLPLSTPSRVYCGQTHVRKGQKLW